MARRTLRDRVAATRRLGFVGRWSERELFAAALAAEEPPYPVLHVHGPGGVGKSALLRVFRTLAEEAGADVLLVDGHEVEPNPQAFEAALAGWPTGPGRPVLLIDTFELLAPLESWLRERLLAGLPADAVVVIAGRPRPGARWSTDPGWRDLVRVLGLGNLSAAEGAELLAGRGVPAELHEAVLAFTGGHPLALSLVLDAHGQAGADAAVPARMQDPDVIGVLLGHLLDAVPGDRHRRALDACAVARFTTESVLRAALPGDDATELFGWLRGLSFVEPGRHGLYPHDLARDALTADLRWRDPQRYTQLRARIREDIVARIRDNTGDEQYRAIHDLMFTFRADPQTRRFWQWETLGAARAEPVRPTDREAVLAMVERHEGAASARVAARWLERQPEAFIVYRDADGVPAGVVAWLSLHSADRAVVEADPVSAAAWRRAHADGSAGPSTTIMRFALDRDAYQRRSHMINVASIQHVRQVVTGATRGWDFLVCADPDYFAPLWARIGYHREPGADATVGGRRFALFGCAWHEVPAPWSGIAPAPTGHARGEPLRLSRAEFDGAVRSALRDLGRVDLLARSPLLASRVLRRRGTADPEGLRALLGEAAAVLLGHPRDEKLYRAVDRTYLRPAATQELAAEVLGLPFSTYRRHLTGGVERIAAWLWNLEQGEPVQGGD